MKKRILKLNCFNNKIPVDIKNPELEGQLPSYTCAVKLYELPGLPGEIRMDIYEDGSSSKGGYRFHREAYPSDLGILWDGKHYYIMVDEDKKEEIVKVTNESMKTAKFIANAGPAWIRFPVAAPVMAIHDEALPNEEPDDEEEQF